MSAYPEILKEVQKMPITEQFKLFNTLKNSLSKYIETEDSEEIILAEEIAESEQAWREYITGKDKGINPQDLKKKLLIAENV
ncbi:hypothetical protein WEU38_16140 [Cyanobacterium aponinum AL20118]|uniref:Addiction module component n=1 Tax=Cyanobacterium aponinum AL20115 TaxID=3090662 RepID=A0AAF0Z8M5_9CHRO|nr:hypothetical protein [Cyanobacterium aponinum]PHV63413.1 hypothetical protein CSQ80_05635 [Cyanobacterium aponinum IPPAS B-1201]WPF88321.1 hypothetical protein SAY89_16215 [Cyanobacterium aponinum AL20115]